MITAKEAKMRTDTLISIKKNEQSFVQLLETALEEIEREVRRSIEEGHYELTYRISLSEIKNNIKKQFPTELSSNQVVTYMHLLLDEIIEALRSVGFKLTPSRWYIDTTAFDISWENIDEE